MTTPQTTDTKKPIDSAYLMKVCAGGIVQAIEGKIPPETLAAIAAAASAYAALQQTEGLQERVRALETQIVMLRSPGMSA